MKYITEKDGRKRKALETVCKECNETYLARESYVLSGRTKFCSKKCAGKHSENKVTLLCDNLECKKEFKRTNSRLKNSRSGKHFCSRKCKEKSQSIAGGMTEIQPDHYGTTESKYREIAFRTYEHKCDRCGYDEYKDILHVHHIDCDRNNNDVKNLRILCRNCHGIVHLEIERGVQMVEIARLVNHKELIKYLEKETDKRNLEIEKEVIQIISEYFEIENNT